MTYHHSTKITYIVSVKLNAKIHTIYPVERKSKIDIHITVDGLNVL